MSGLEGLRFPSSSEYTILEEIGRGGMGIVFLAEKDCEGVVDTVVLKTIRTYNPDHEERLKAEANIATQLRHENIVKTYGLETVPLSALPAEFRQEIDALTDDRAVRKHSGRIAIPGDLREHLRRRRLAIAEARRDEKRLYLMVMDYVEGTDLRTLHLEHVRAKRLLPVPLAAFLVSRVCRALAYAHDFIVHRDVSPENVLINAQGVVKLSDFGIAVGEGEQKGGFHGKIAYASPEQIAGEKIDARTDVYSLGLVLYEILTGTHPLRPPLVISATQEKLAFVKSAMERGFADPYEVREDVSPLLSALCMKMLHRDRDKRYARIGDAGTDLEQKYLYATGFGPTNNSLGAYLEVHADDFHTVTREQASQLAFLKRADGRYAIERRTDGTP